MSLQLLKKRLAKLEQEKKKKQKNGLLILIKSKGSTLIRSRELGESNKEYVKFLDSIGARYVYIPSFTKE